MSKENSLGYSSSKPSVTLLQAGKHVVNLIAFMVTNSGIANFKGEEKENQPEYVDRTPQLMLTFAGKSGVITDRLNFKGFIRYADLDDSIKESGKIVLNKTTYNVVCVGEYACIKTKDGLMRLVDKDKTKQAHQRADQFFWACQLPEGSSEDDLKSVIDNKTPIEITVENRKFEGRDHLEITRFKQVAQVLEETPEAEE